MKGFLVALLFLFGAESQDSLEGGEDVVEVTAANIKDHVKTDSFTLVEYYSPTCGKFTTFFQLTFVGYCRAFASEYAKVGTYLKGVISVARVNVLQEKELWSNLRVSCVIFYL